MDSKASLVTGVLLFALVVAAAGALTQGGGAERAVAGAVMGAVLAVILHRVAGALLSDGRMTPGEAWGYGVVCLIASLAMYLSFWREEMTVVRVLLLAAVHWLATFVLVVLRMRLDPVRGGGRAARKDVQR